MMNLRRGSLRYFLGFILVLIVLYTMALYNNRIVITLSKLEQQQTLSDRTTMDTKTNRPPVPQVQFPSIPEVNPIPNDNILNQMTLAQLSNLYYGYVHSTQVICSRVLRMGKVADGGWEVCDDPRYNPTPNKCLVYSIGINYDFSYDDAIEKYYGCEVHSYDPSMAKVNDHIRGKNIHFHKTGIDMKNNNKTNGWILYTLGTLRAMNHHTPSERRVDILKMDVEGAESRSLLTALNEESLKDVRQLSFELHLLKEDNDPNQKWVTRALVIFRQLWDLGFRLYHTNSNTDSKQTYTSKIHGVQRTSCHELNMVNSNLKK